MKNFVPFREELTVPLACRETREKSVEMRGRDGMYMCLLLKPWCQIILRCQISVRPTCDSTLATQHRVLGWY